MTIRDVFTNRKQHIQGPHNIVHLSENSVFAVDNRVRRSPLLRKMDHRLGLNILDRSREKVVIGDVADTKFDGLSREFRPNSQPFREWKDRSQSLRADFMVPLPAREVVDYGDRMTARG